MSTKASNTGDPTPTTTTATTAAVTASSTVDSFEIALSNHVENEAIPFVSFDRTFSIDGDNQAGQPVQVAVDNGKSEHYGIRITEEQSGDIKLRNLFPQDIPELKEVCSQWFPIE